MPVVGRVAGVKVLDHRLHFLARLGGREVFVKYHETALRGRKEGIYVALLLEKKALRALRGLAVPALLEPEPRELSRLVERPPASVVVLERVKGRELPLLRLSPGELFGFWAAIAEQLVAFRRLGVIYTDIKKESVLARLRPLGLTIIDFNRVCPLSPRRDYPAVFFGGSPTCAPPEMGFRRRLTEASLVYQLGMLWAQSADKALNNAQLGDPRRLGRLLARVARGGGPALARLLESCLARDPSRRPATYETVLARLREAGLPAASLEAWARLRAPYAARLRELGLSGPEAAESGRPSP